MVKQARRQLKRCGTIQRRSLSVCCCYNITPSHDASLVRLRAPKLEEKNKSRAKDCCDDFEVRRMVISCAELSASMCCLEQNKRGTRKKGDNIMPLWRTSSSPSTHGKKGWIARCFCLLRREIRDQRLHQTADRELTAEKCLTGNQGTTRSRNARRKRLRVALFIFASRKAGPLLSSGSGQACKVR